MDELEHAEGVLRGVASRPHLYAATAPAAHRVLAALDAARARVAELEAENGRLGRLIANGAEVQELLHVQNRIKALCRDGYFLGHGGAHAVFVDDVMSCIPTVDGGTRKG